MNLKTRIKEVFCFMIALMTVKIVANLNRMDCFTDFFGDVLGGIFVAVFFTVACVPAIIIIDKIKSINNA